MRRLLINLALSVLAVSLLMQAAHAQPKDEVYAAAEAARKDQLELLREVVNIDSGTGDVKGGRKVAAVLARELKTIGAKVEMVPAEKPGYAENLVATLDGTGKARILMIGHLDTVFEPGTVNKWSYSTDTKRAYGPGVADEKGGVVGGVYALKLLQQLGFKNYRRITYLIESSEEKGSPGTRALISRLLRAADVEFNLEPGDPPDNLTIWRKGSVTFQIDVKGKAAHAGVNPGDGHNAALELMHQAAGLKQFPQSGDGITVNLTILRAGERNNIIPDAAMAQVNARVLKPGDVGRIERVLQANARKVSVPGTSVTVTKDPAYPPLPRNAATDALAGRAKEIYRQIGREIGTSGNGGASQSALAAEAGVPALDGLGPVGGNFHSNREYLELDSVTPRLYLLTKLIMSLGRDPIKGATHVKR
ncbi:MAG: glutamate carboxypeptidase [Alphaproteobacteria bacterium]